VRAIAFREVRLQHCVGWYSARDGCSTCTHDSPTTVLRVTRTARPNASQLVRGSKWCFFTAARRRKLEVIQSRCRNRVQGNACRARGHDKCGPSARRCSGPGTGSKAPGVARAVFLMWDHVPLREHAVRSRQRKRRMRPPLLLSERAYLLQTCVMGETGKASRRRTQLPQINLRCHGHCRSSTRRCSQMHE
jgi:hypothetical protein